MLRLEFRWIGTVAVLLLVATLAAIGCKRSDPRSEGLGSELGQPPPPTYGCSADGGELQIEIPSDPIQPAQPATVCPSFPNTTPTAQPQWDYFAWNSFIAANWPAVIPAKANGHQRGFADLTKNFATAASTDLLVWETFKEKRELFQPYLNPDGSYTPQTPVNFKEPGPWNQEVKYGPLDPLTKRPFSFPVCQDSKPPVSSGRRFAQLGKLGISGRGDPDSLDETIEVASEALESDPGSLPVQGRVVGPRVWKGTPMQTNPQPVYYEVKVNYDYYNYVQLNGYFVDANAQQHLPLQLPYRTSASATPGPAGPKGLPISVTNYKSSDCIGPTYYDPMTKIPISGMNPCPAGSIQIKTAWIPLTHNEHASRYHTAKAAVFRTQNGRTCIDSNSSVTYGLVGIHIIQRIHAVDAAGNALPQGGTFIFATWEHVNNDRAGFTYSNYYPPQVAAQFNNNPTPGFYPPLTSPLTVTRRFPILPNTVQANQIVHDKLRLINPHSVWLNYRLIGVQFQPIDLPTERPAVPPFPTTLPNPDPTHIGQPAYLANSVIETNDGLQLFRGLPPNVAVNGQFSSNAIPGNPSATAFDRNTANVAFPSNVRQPDPGSLAGFNMGGCMGCHGVAQLKGFSFSFILAEGQLGGEVDTEDDFNVAPLPPLPPLSVTAVNPTSGSIRGGTQVVITGTNFQSGATVTFGGTAALRAVVGSSTKIIAVTPAKPAGPVDVKVTNPGGKAATLSNGFSYHTP